MIQTRIINNSNLEVNLEITLKLTTFAGKQVYSLVCKNRNLLIKMDKLEQANKLRSLMVGQISHDLRTPLNSMIILLDMAVFGEKSSKEAKFMVKEYIKPALISCNLLMSLINDILNFTRQDFDQTKKDVMNYEPVDIRETLRTISPGFSKRA